ncbi:MAG TPA: hypothetical protein VGV90_07970 [Solirubrobacteraceae bacterium]|nr:hypothetical protein [Solirubrobacteraceae bacterium]
MALTLDDILPAPQFSERHELRIAAPPAAVWAALLEIRLADGQISRTLMGIRLLPGRLAGHESRMASARLLEEGPVPVLDSDPGRSVVAGGVLQPWKLTGGDAPPALDAAQLRAFARPGWVKAGMDFVLEPDRAGTRVCTETRVTATDARTRAKFGLYWLLIRAGSGLIRRDLLRALARRAAGGAPT